MSIEEAQAIQEQRIRELRTKLADLPWDHPERTLEIGCGHGHYLTAYAAEYPQELCIAVDIIKERIEKAERKTARAGHTNVHWIRGTAEDLLEAMPEGATFNKRVLVLFPDPWPKRRHWKNRLIRPDFLSRLAQRTASGTELCFRTDYGPYFEWATEVLTAHPDWDLVPGAAWPFEHQTVFEAKAPTFQSLIACQVRKPS
jgi:tRNA (guanine-N7-)-methyltransferase